MTDDTLRQECEKLLDGLEATYSDVALYGGTLVGVDKKYKADCAKLLAFARAQQAKGLREAAEIADRLGDYDIRNVIMLKATAREQGHV